MFHVTVFEDKNFVELVKWGHKSRTLMLQLVSLQEEEEETPEFPLSLYACVPWQSLVRTQQEICKPGREDSPGTESSGTVIRDSVAF